MKRCDHITMCNENDNFVVYTLLFTVVLFTLEQSEQLHIEKTFVSKLLENLQKKYHQVISQNF